MYLKGIFAALPLNTHVEEKNRASNCEFAEAVRRFPLSIIKYTFQVPSKDAKSFGMNINLTESIIRDMST